MFAEEKQGGASGMFSKAGRLSLEMFSLLQEKDHILSGKRRTYDQSADILLKSPFHQNSTMSQKDGNAQGGRVHRTLRPSDSLQNVLTRKAEQQSPPREKQPFALIATRDHYLNLQEKLHSNNQKFGMYNPKYHYIFSRSPLYEDKEYHESNNHRVLEFRHRIFEQEQAKFRHHKRARAAPQAQSGHQHNSALTKLPTTHSRDASLHQHASDRARGLHGGNSQQLQLHVSESSPLLGLDYDKPRKKVVGPIGFDKMLPKKSITDSNMLIRHL